MVSLKSQIYGNSNSKKMGGIVCVHVSMHASDTKRVAFFGGYALASTKRDIFYKTYQITTSAQITQCLQRQSLQIISQDQLSSIIAMKVSP